MMGTRGAHVRLGYPSGIAIAALAAFGLATPARADLQFTVGTAAATPGSTSSFEVTLTNTGPAAITIGGFSLVLEAETPGISLTEATTATAEPYIFGGFSLFGPTIGPFLLSPGQALDASDIADGVGATGAVLNPGTTAGLAHVIFTVGPQAPNGPAIIRLRSFPETSVSDQLSGNLTFTPMDGSIVVVPEPASALLLASALVAAAVIVRCSRLRAATVVRRS